MIHQFEMRPQAQTYWVDKAGGRQVLLGKSQPDKDQILTYQRYRIAYRAIARGTDSRTMISSILPRNCFSSNSMNVAFEPTDERTQLVLLAFLNSFSFDHYLRQQVRANLTMFFIYQCPVPRLTNSNPNFSLLWSRASRLICTTPEFDDLAKAVGLKSHNNGAADPAERAKLRAELDGLVAHLYGLTEAEFAHILGTFPLVPQPVKVAAQNAYRDVERGLIS